MIDQADVNIANINICNLAVILDCNCNLIQAHWLSVRNTYNENNFRLLKVCIKVGSRHEENQSSKTGNFCRVNYFTYFLIIIDLPFSLFTSNLFPYSYTPPNIIHHHRDPHLSIALHFSNRAVT